MKEAGKSYIIEVEVCSNCHLHSWCSRHQQSKYNEFFDLFKSKAEDLSREIFVIKNNVPATYKKIGEKSHVGQNRYFDLGLNQIVMFPRFGAFQIFFNNVLIFSKLKSGLWPHLDRIVQFVASIIQTHKNGQDINKYSLDYRIKNDQNEHFLLTYKAQIVRQLGSERKKARSLQKIGECQKNKSFKSRKLMTQSRKKANEQMTDSSPIINKQKFTLFESSQRPYNRVQYIHTTANNYEESLDKSEEIEQFELKVNRNNKNDDQKEKRSLDGTKSPYSKKSDKKDILNQSNEKQSSLLKKLQKLDGISPKIKLNLERIKNQSQIKKKLEQNEIQKQRLQKLQNEKIQKVDSAVNGWSEDKIGSQQFFIQSKTKISEEEPKLAITKKPSIRQNLQFPSHGTILESQKTMTDNNLSNAKMNEISIKDNENKNKAENEKENISKVQQGQSDILGSENYEENYFEEAESEISWEAGKMFERYKQVIKWMAEVSKTHNKQGNQEIEFELKQESNVIGESIERSEILVKGRKQRTGINQAEERIEISKIEESKVIKSTILGQMQWEGEYKGQQFVLLKGDDQQNSQINRNAKNEDKLLEDEYSSIVDEMGMEDQIIGIEEDQVDQNYNDVLKDMEDNNYDIKINEVHDSEDISEYNENNANNAGKNDNNDGKNENESEIQYKQGQQKQRYYNVLESQKKVEKSERRQVENMNGIQTNGQVTVQNLITDKQENKEVDKDRKGKNEQSKGKQENKEEAKEKQEDKEENKDAAVKEFVANKNEDLAPEKIEQNKHCNWTATYINNTFSICEQIQL